MSPDNKDNSKAARKEGAKTEKIQDLKDAKVSEKDAGDVKGGLNPQPLPPRWGPVRGT